MAEKTKISYKGKSKKVPKKYVSTLKGEEKKKQVKSILQKSSAPRPKTSAPQRRSSYTIKFEKEYGEKLDSMKGGRSKKNTARSTSKRRYFILKFNINVNFLVKHKGGELIVFHKWEKVT